MDVELIVYDTESGSMYDYGPILEKVEYTTARKISAGQLDFTYVQRTPINMTEGARVQLYADGRGIFQGYVFTIERDRHGVVEVTAYDQLRYLKTNESYSFIGKKLGEIIRQIARDMRLQTGILEDTGYAIPALTKEDAECLDIIDYGLAITQHNTGKAYSVFDDFGKLSLRESGSLLSTAIIGNGSLLTDYKYKSDIDSDTYNQIKLVRPNKETGQGDVYLFGDSETIKKWGLLRRYEKVDENLNAAQINEQGNIMMAYYDRVLRDLSVDCMGIPGLRAGAMATFRIYDIPELKDGYKLLLDKVKHTFSGGSHTMSLEARMLGL